MRKRKGEVSLSPDFKKWLRDIRRDKGLSPEDISNKLNRRLSPNTIRNIEKDGHEFCNETTLLLLADGLDCKHEDFFQFLEQNPSNGKTLHTVIIEEGMVANDDYEILDQTHLEH